MQAFVATTGTLSLLPRGTAQPPITCTNHNAPRHAPRLSRRKIVHLALALPLASTTTCDAADDQLKNTTAETETALATEAAAEEVCEKLEHDCDEFLQMISPICASALLWRGQDTCIDDLTLSSPASDLLDADTYTADGARFFRSLDVALEALRKRRDDVPLPRAAHVGSGSAATAAEWGLPHTVWPTARLRVAAWRDAGSLLYAPGDTLARAWYRKGPLTFGGHLRDALMQGREILFECNSFYIVPARLLPAVLARLQTRD